MLCRESLIEPAAARGITRQALHGLNLLQRTALVRLFADREGIEEGFDGVGEQQKALAREAAGAFIRISKARIWKARAV